MNHKPKASDAGYSYIVDTFSIRDSEPLPRGVRGTHARTRADQYQE